MNTLIQKFGVRVEQFCHPQQMKFINKSKIDITNSPLQAFKLSEEIIIMTNSSLTHISKFITILLISKWEKDWLSPPNLNSGPKYAKISFLWLPIEIYNSYSVNHRCFKIFLMGFTDNDITLILYGHAYLFIPFGKQ